MMKQELNNYTIKIIEMCEKLQQIYDITNYFVNKTQMFIAEANKGLIIKKEEYNK